MESYFFGVGKVMNRIISMKVDGIKGLIREWKRGPMELAKRIHNGIMKTAVVLNNEIGKQITQRRLRVNNTLFNSMNIETKGTMRVVVSVNADYAGFVEFGTRPHYVPHRALYKWALQKFKPGSEVAHAIATATQKRILKSGTKERRYARDSINNISDRIGKIWDNLV